MNKATIVCCCSEASEGCDKTCPKGRLYEPKQVFNVPWVRYCDMAMVKELRDKVLREMREA